MKSILLVLLIFVSFSAFAHDDIKLTIDQVQIIDLQGCKAIQVELTNHYPKQLWDVNLEIEIAKGKHRTVHIEQIDPKKKVQILESFCNETIEEASLKITVNRLMGKEHDWLEWSPNLLQKQTNTAFSEFYVDAPWRMKKFNQNGDLNGIPVHFFLHDADLVLLMDIQIDNINIRLKNASDPNFGPILTFNSWNASDFANLFSCASPNDPALDIKPFSLNTLTPTSSQTFDFDIDSDFFGDFITVTEKYWYFDFTIPPSFLQGMSDEVDILVQVEYANFSIADTYFGLRVFRKSESLPSLDDYYRGDTHLHSMYTQSDAEIGLPLCSTKKAAQMIGIDWITTTDHTSDFDNYGNGISANWDRIRSEAQQLNSEDSSLIYIAGQEVAANNANDRLVHMLAYPDPANPFSLPFIGDGNGDLFPTNVSIKNALDNISNNNGFAYAAHPFATDDELPLIPVNGGIWNLGSTEFPVNGSNFPLTGGNIICNDTNLDSDVFYLPGNDTLIYPGLKGGQIWNAKKTLSSTEDELDPWDLQTNQSGFTPVDTSSNSFHWKRFKQGQEIVNTINRIGLITKNNNSATENWKMYYSGGNDAHGSFNYSNTDDFASLGSISNNAVGKISTATYCPNGMGTNGIHVLDALKKGRSTLTDGPLIALSLSKNGNNDPEVFMGDDTRLDINTVDDQHVIIDAATTIEFGTIRRLTAILGTEAGESKKVLTLSDSTGNFSLSYKLTNLIDSIVPGFILPQEKYMYIRFEAESYRDYSFEIYQNLQYEVFHTVTNPIWFKYDDQALTNEIEEIDIKLYPNPTSDMITLETSLDNGRLTIKGLDGKIIDERNISKGKNHIDFQNYSSGIYVFTIQFNNGLISKRVIKL